MKLEIIIIRNVSYAWKFNFISNSCSVSNFGKPIFDFGIISFQKILCLEKNLQKQCQLPSHKTIKKKFPFSGVSRSSISNFPTLVMQQNWPPKLVLFLNDYQSSSTVSGAASQHQDKTQFSNKRTQLSQNGWVFGMATSFQLQCLCCLCFYSELNTLSGFGPRIKVLKASPPPWHHQRTPTATGSAWFLQCETVDFVKTYYYFQYSKTQKKKYLRKKNHLKK